MPDDIASAVAQHTAYVNAGDTKAAAQLLSAAQRAAPSSPEFAVRQLDACLQSNQLVCAAHAARALLRHAPADHPELCRFLSSARAFGARAAALCWCPIGERCTRPVANATPDESVAAASGAGLDDGQLWRAESFIATLKALLADDALWRGASAQKLLNHAVMQQMQAPPLPAPAPHPRPPPAPHTGTRLHACRATPRWRPRCTRAASASRPLRSGRCIPPTLAYGRAAPSHPASHAVRPACRRSRRRTPTSRCSSAALRGARGWRRRCGCGQRARRAAAGGRRCSWCKGPSPLLEGGAPICLPWPAERLRLAYAPPSAA